MSRLFSLVYDRMTAPMEEACLGGWRAELLADVSGAVLEIGAGTGANLAHYPAGVTRLVLAEPDPGMRRKLDAKVAAWGRPAEVVDAPAERLPFADGTFDAVVSTLVLCSVRDPQQALGELRRVLADDGRLVLIEHVAAGPVEPDRHRWQRRVEPVWKRLAGNCHLTRDTQAALVAAGFDVSGIERQSIRKAAPLVRPSIRGSVQVAR